MVEGADDAILPFIYVEQFRQLVCSTCHFAVQDRGRHLKEKHQIPIHQREEILAAYTQYETLTDSDHVPDRRYYFDRLFRESSDLLSVPVRRL